MRKVHCPICGHRLMLVSDDIFINFDLRKANEIETCENCKRKIRFSSEKRDLSKNGTVLHGETIWQ